MRGGAVALTAVMVLAGCGGSAQPGTATDRVQADSVALAAEQFDNSAFDTLTWNGDTAAFNRGHTTYVWSCQKCHGTTGAGDAGFVFQGDTLHPPSLIAPDWKYATDLAGMREAIFAGNAEGMPHWGLVGMKVRDIDAVTRYILEGLRAAVDTTKGM